MKNFAKSKNSRMFAVPKFIKILMGCIFLCTANSVLAKNTGYRTSLGYTAISIVMDFGESEGDSLSCIHIVTNNFRLNMPKSTKITNSVNNSNGIGTPYGAKSVLSANQTNNNGCNVSGNVKSIKIINGISADQLQTVIKTLFKEFIDSGLITLLSNAKNDTL